MFNAESVRNEINEQLKLWKQPSMGFGVVKDGEVLLADGFGMANEAKGLKSNADTLYQIGSCSKAFTATAVAKLVDQGKVNWDDKVIKYIPSFKYKDKDVTERITVRDLLCHRTGLPRHDMYWVTNDLTRDQMVTSMENMNSCWSFRTNWFYNNFCFVVAGRIVEVVSGMTWEEYLTEELLKPIGMNRTYFYVDDMLNDENSAVGYQLVHGSKDGTYEQVDYMKFTAEDKEKGVGAPFGPAGSIISCINDMLKWAQFNLDLGKVGDKQIVSEANMKEVTRPQMLMANPLIKDWPEMDFYSYGFGWFIESYRGHKMVEHGGNITGFSAVVVTIPDQKLAAVGLVNYNGSFVHYAQAYNVCDDLMDAEQKDWHEEFRALMKAVRGEDGHKAQIEHLYGKKLENTVPTHALEAFTGKYKNVMYGTAEVTIDNGQLYMVLGKVNSHLTHFHYDSFTICDEDCPFNGHNITFHIDKFGKISSLEFEIALPAKTEVFTKVEG